MFVKLLGLILSASFGAYALNAPKNLCVDQKCAGAIKPIVRHYADFETGLLTANGAKDSAGRLLPDAGYKMTLPDPQSGFDSIKTGNAGFGPDTKADMKVVSSFKEPDTKRGVGKLVYPRRGQYFLMQKLVREKNYEILNCSGDMPQSECTLDKPRVHFDWGNDSYRFESGKEFWVGFSLYVPSNMEVDTGGSGSEQRRASHLIVNTRPSSTFFSISTQAYTKTSAEMSYVLSYQVDATQAVETSSMKKIDVDLGHVNRGKWTDFVVRAKQNPFTVATNPKRDLGITDAVDKTFPANDGVLQIWMRNQSTGRMELKFNLSGKPVGLVPNMIEGGTHISWRIYKFSWKYYYSQGGAPSASNIFSPYMIGWDELSFGLRENGTGYQDVHPMHEGQP
jgi:hypothetical protein